MTNELLRRDIVQNLIGISAIGLLARGTTSAMAQTGVSPVKVDTKGLVAKIKFEAVLGGFLSDLNDRYKLRVTELTLEPGGHIGEHNHVGPGIRQVTSGYMTYVQPDKPQFTVRASSSSNRETSTIPLSTRQTRRWCTSCSRCCPPTSRDRP